MNTVDFLKKIWPEEGIYLLAVKTDSGFRHKGVRSAEEACAYIAGYEKHPDWNIFHACAAYMEMPKPGHVRTSDNWLSAKAFWCDIDCGKGDGYATKQEALDALLMWCDSRGLPSPMVIDSGHGIHAYWPLTEAVNPTDWVKAASAIKSAMKADGFKADPTRTADFASILRPVGSHNRKDPANPLEVTLIQDAEATDTMAFMAAISNLIVSSPEFFDLGAAPSYLTGEKTEAVAEYPEVECSAELIAGKCRQMQRLRDTRGDVSYETWRGLIGLISFCKEGLPLAEAWSERRAETGHTQTDVALKFNSWGSAPTTCDFLANCDAKMCENCPFKGKIKTPLVLGRVAPQPEAETVEVHQEGDGRKEKLTVEVPPLPEGYEWNGSQMVHWTPDKEGNLKPHPFSRMRFYLVARIRNADGEYEYVARAHLPDGSLRTFDLPGCVIGQSGSKLMGTLGSYEIFSTNNSDAGVHMSSYLRDQIHTIMKSKQVTATYSSFGWQEDGSFLVGTRLYKEDGTVSEALLAGYAKDNAGALPIPKGTLEGYAEPLNWIYSRPGMEPMQYVICSMLASPLVKGLDAAYRGIPVAITGADSGKGKTTACLAALYAFGDAAKLTVAGEAGATSKARSALLGTMSDIPVLFDEVTNMRPEVLSSLAYALSNGMEPMRLRAGTGSVRFADRETWNLHAACTGNTYMGAKLAANGQTEAEAMRIFELRVDDYLVPRLDPILVSEKLNEIASNAGCAGEELVKWLVTHRLEAKRIISEVREQLGKHSLKLRNAKYRFFRSHATLTLAMARILKDLGIVRFDLDALTKFAVDAIEKLCEMTEVTNAVNYDDALVQMLSDFQVDIAQTETYELPITAKPYEIRVRNKLVGRAIPYSQAHTSDKYSNRILLSTRAVRDWCSAFRVDTSAFARHLKNRGVLITVSERATLGRSTTIVSAQERCWMLDYKMVGMLNGEQNDEPNS